MDIICVDFDGTIVDHVYPKIGKPVPEAIESMKLFIDNRAKIILYTMRSGEELQEAVDYIEDKGIDLYGVNNNPTQHTWSQSPKVYGNMYIDDAAIGTPMCWPQGFNRPCVDWSKIKPIVVGKLNIPF